MTKLFTSVAVVSALLQPNYRAETEQFRKERASGIAGENGWAALTDLYWLDANGQFTVGRGASNGIVLHAPSAPDRLGIVTVDAKGVTLRVQPGVDARSKSQPVRELQLTPDTSAADGVTVGGMTVTLIERAKRRALRVWDRDATARVHFKGLRWSPIDPAWKIDARFVPHQPAPTMKVQNIIGQTVEMKNPGAAVFTIGGHEYHLEALLEEPDATELFFMFRDATSGTTTYGAGRYMYSPLPANGRVTLDFNRAVNPPCAFTEFATCPLPPAANRLSVAIGAGELQYKKD